MNKLVSIFTILALVIIVLGLPNASYADKNENVGVVGEVKQDVDAKIENTNIDVNLTEVDVDARNDIDNEVKVGNENYNKVENSTGSQSTDVNVHGNKTQIYSLVAPDNNAEQNMTQGSAYSIFGGINTSKTEAQKTCQDKIRVAMGLHDAGLWDNERTLAEVEAAWKQYLDETAPQRFLGFLWKTKSDDRNLMNLLGLLDW